MSDQAENVTALTITARVHQGLGTSPYRLVKDSEVLAAYLCTGEVVEDPELGEAMQRFLAAVEEGHGVTVVLPHSEMTYTPPRRRWWHRNPDKRAAWRSFAAGNEHPDR